MSRNRPEALRVVQARAEAVRSRVEEQVADILRADPSPAGQAFAARYAGSSLDTESRRAHARGIVPACAAGCASCCHVHVDATAPEIAGVAAYLRATRPAEGLAALLPRLARARDLSDEERWAARVPCALLGEDGRCTVYPVRPLRCRAFHSSSADACREALAGRAEIDPPTIPALDRAYDAVEEGYDRALAAAGIDPGIARLEAGLLAALGDELGPASGSAR